MEEGGECCGGAAMTTQSGLGTGEENRDRQRQAASRGQLPNFGCDDRRPRNWWSFRIRNRNNSQEPDSKTRDRNKSQKTRDRVR